VFKCGITNYIAKTGVKPKMLPQNLVDFFVVA